MSTSIFGPRHGFERDLVASYIKNRNFSAGEVLQEMVTPSHPLHEAVSLGNRPSNSDSFPDVQSDHSPLGVLPLGETSESKGHSECHSWLVVKEPSQIDHLQSCLSMAYSSDSAHSIGEPTDTFVQAVGYGCLKKNSLEEETYFSGASSSESPDMGGSSTESTPEQTLGSTRSPIVPTTQATTSNQGYWIADDLHLARPVSPRVQVCRAGFYDRRTLLPIHCPVHPEAQLFQQYSPGNPHIGATLRGRDRHQVYCTPKLVESPDADPRNTARKFELIPAPPHQFFERAEKAVWSLNRWDYHIRREPPISLEECLKASRARQRCADFVETPVEEFGQAAAAAIPES